MRPEQSRGLGRSEDHLNPQRRQLVRAAEAQDSSGTREKSPLGSDAQLPASTVGLPRPGIPWHRAHVATVLEY